MDASCAAVAFLVVDILATLFLITTCLSTLSWPAVRKFTTVILSVATSEHLTFLILNGLHVLRHVTSSVLVTS
jgi:hypothetical protein